MNNAYKYPESDTRQSGRPLSGRRIIVDRLLGQLFTLTVSIRSLGVKTRLDRADKLFEIDRYEQLYNHLVISVFGSCLGNSKKFGIGDMLPHSTAPINNQDTKSATYQPDVSSFGASGIFKRVAQAPLTECFANEDFKAKRFFLWVTEPEISYVPIEEEIRTEEEQELSQENYSILQPMIPAQLSAPEATESKFIAFIFDQFTEVQKRLVEVNLRRRNRFICAQRHARRLQKQQGSEKKNKPESEQLNPSGRPEPSVSAAPRRQTEQMTQQQPSTPKEEMGQGHPETAVHSSRTKSSGTDPTMLEGDVKASGVSQPPMTVVSSTSLKVAYPRAPSIEGSKRSVFRCPCCCQDLPIVYAERSKWRSAPLDLIKMLQVLTKLTGSTFRRIYCLIPASYPTARKDCECTEHVETGNFTWKKNTGARITGFAMLAAQRANGTPSHALRTT